MRRRSIWTVVCNVPARCGSAGAEALLPSLRDRPALCGRNPMQRYVRDVHAIDAHLSFDGDIAGAQYGRAVPGVEEDAGLL